MSKLLRYYLATFGVVFILTGFVTWQYFPGALQTFLTIITQPVFLLAGFLLFSVLLWRGYETKLRQDERVKMAAEMAAKRKARNETIQQQSMNNPPRKTRKPKAPTKQADWWKWHDAWMYVIFPNLGKKKDSEIQEEMAKLDYPATQYFQIRELGEAGELNTPPWW